MDVVEDERDSGVDSDAYAHVKVADSREEERAMSNEVVGGEALE